MAEHFDSNSVNNAPVKEVRAHSTFDLSHYIFGTHRFANYNVNFARNVVAKQVLPLRSSDVIDSYTLKAPLMQDVQKTKEYFFVPKQAILPNNWEKIERLPALGDDVDAQFTNSVFYDFANNYLSKFISFFYDGLISEDDFTLEQRLAFYFRRFLFAELFFSQGSLLASTGVHLSSLLRFGNGSDDMSDVDFDTYFDGFITDFLTILSQGVSVDVVFGSNKYRIDNTALSDYKLSRAAITIHRFLEMARDDYNFSFIINGAPALLSNFEDLFSSYFDASCWCPFVDSFGDYNKVEFNIERCAAYQIICAHYFTNDSIDYIHDADLWRQNMKALYLNNLVMRGDERVMPNFSYNGVLTEYDFLAGYCLGNILEDAISCLTTDLAWYFGYSCGFFINLLGWRRSLRFGDYFVGSKARPLAVGDFSVAVNNNAVDVVDITKKIAYQRLANNVNRIGNSIKEWYQKIMGSELAYDYHNPMWLASTRSTVYAAKNENTNNADISSLGAVTSSANFVGRDSDFEFTMRPDRNGVVIGITYYDIRRAYSYGIDRMVQHVDRFDGFIPDLQFVGDQEINGNELVAGIGSIFGYTLRNMEYKQYYDEAYGAFATGKLPGFNFNFYPEFNLTDNRSVIKPISPEFIRSRCDEFDGFYVSLSGYSNANYFHFIVKTFNSAPNANLPMVYAPQIL